MECTLRSWLWVPSPIFHNTRFEEKIMRQWPPVICQWELWWGIDDGSWTRSVAQFFETDHWPQLRRAPNRIWFLLTTYRGWFQTLDWVRIFVKLEPIGKLPKFEQLRRRIVACPETVQKIMHESKYSGSEYLNLLWLVTKCDTGKKWRIKILRVWIFYMPVHQSSRMG